ncbi:MAG: ABC transporter ATP-binding protein [Actinobacteria bacterium]|nr:ABC transporter ATP-binding protein [Actinomycetota bacterium]
MLSVRDLTVRFGDTVAVADVDLDVGAGEVVCVLGPSGCGKSTLLRTIAGLERPAAGEVVLDGRDLAGVRPDQRGLGMMFQDGALFPHRDVAGNVAFGLRMRGWDRADVTARVHEVLALVGLRGFGGREVSTLSGGEQQRVALARALAPEPNLLMLDEPLGSLDRGLRDRLIGELRELFDRLGSTVLYVTHDQDEALALADRVVVMRAGRVVQAAPPDELWRRPADAFVARFLGQTNLVAAHIEDDRAVTVLGDVPARGHRDGDVAVLFLPDALRLTRDGHRGVVTARRFAGDHVVVTVELAAGPQLEVACWGGDAPAVGSDVAVTVDPDATWVVDP